MTIGPGQTLGRYRLETSLGRGGMAEVFRARDQKLGRTVAVKVVLPLFAAQEHFGERFLREARVVAALEHPGIVPVYDYGEQDGLPFLVMPYLDGGTLQRRMTGQAQPLDQVVPWIRQLGAALDAAHAAGVLHRDVKPANVLVGKDERPLLADFGIAKIAESATRLTATGVVVGTPVYMAPELALGKPASPASDLYSLAVVAYELLTGQPPFEGETALSVMHQHVQTPAPPPSTRVPTLPRALDEVFAQALAKDPATRPPSCRAFAESLASVLSTAERADLAAGGRPWSSVASLPTVQVPPTAATVHNAGTPPGGAAGMPRRWPWLAVGALAVILGLAVWLARRPPAGGAAVVGRTAAKPTEIAPVGLAVAPSPSPSPSPSPVSAPPASQSAASAQSSPLGKRPAQATALDTASSPRPAPSAAPAPEPVAARSEEGGEPELGLEPVGRARLSELRPELGHQRPTAEQFRALERLAAIGRQRRGAPAAAAAIETFARGGLAYLSGDLDGARRALAEVLRGQIPPPLEVSALPLVRQAARSSGGLADWEVAIAFGDPKREAGALLEPVLRANPQDDWARLGRAIVERLDGRHAEALADAAAVYERMPSGRLAQLVAEESRALRRPAEALEWYRKALAEDGMEMTLVPVQAAKLARELGKGDEAKRILDRACERRNRAACREREQLR
ncbi:MAG: protein kinase domain-containing protein [Acidobacteriota bacterium]